MQRADLNLNSQLCLGNQHNKTSFLEELDFQQCQFIKCQFRLQWFQILLNNFSKLPIPKILPKLLYSQILLATQLHSSLNLNSQDQQTCFNSLLISSPSHKNSSPQIPLVLSKTVLLKSNIQLPHRQPMIHSEELTLGSHNNQFYSSQHLQSLNPQSQSIILLRWMFSLRLLQIRSLNLPLITHPHKKLPLLLFKLEEHNKQQLRNSNSFSKWWIFFHQMQLKFLWCPTDSNRFKWWWIKFKHSWQVFNYPNKPLKHQLLPKKQNKSSNIQTKTRLHSVIYLRLKLNAQKQKPILTPATTPSPPLTQPHPLKAPTWTPSIHFQATRPSHHKQLIPLACYNN